MWILNSIANSGHCVWAYKLIQTLDNTKEKVTIEPMKKKILLADDDIDEINLISGILVKGGYDIILSENGNDLEKKDLEMVDLFLIDINMKGIYGTDICRRLKNTQSTRHKPVILISAAIELNKDAIHCGADDFISKPFEKNKLLETVQLYL